MSTEEKLLGLLLGFILGVSTMFIIIAIIARVDHNATADLKCHTAAVKNGQPVCAVYVRRDER